MSLTFWGYHRSFLTAQFNMRHIREPSDTLISKPTTSNKLWKKHLSLTAFWENNLANEPVSQFVFSHCVKWEFSENILLLKSLSDAKCCRFFEQALAESLNLSKNVSSTWKVTMIVLILFQVATHQKFTWFNLNTVLHHLFENSYAWSETFNRKRCAFYAAT